MAAPLIPKVGIKVNAATIVTLSPISEAKRLNLGWPVPEKKLAKTVWAEKNTMPGDISRITGRMPANSPENNHS